MFPATELNLDGDHVGVGHQSVGEQVNVSESTGDAGEQKGDTASGDLR
jgi:hypothetical protein